jgi:nucleotide-binding universal stress UspA family protein
MATLSRFLVATDYSDCSLTALRAAVSLARQLGASIHVVHVWSAPYFGPEYADLRIGDERKSIFSLIRDKAAADMEAFVARVEVQGVVVTTRIESGEPVSRLIDLIREEAPDLVVVGTHGRTGAKRWLLGSVAERIVQLSPSPVLTVPQRADTETVPETAAP